MPTPIDNVANASRNNPISTVFQTGAANPKSTRKKPNISNDYEGYYLYGCGANVNYNLGIVPEEPVINPYAPPSENENLINIIKPTLLTNIKFSRIATSGLHIMGNTAINGRRKTFKNRINGTRGFFEIPGADYRLSIFYDASGTLGLGLKEHGNDLYAFDTTTGEIYDSAYIPGASNFDNFGVSTIGPNIGMPYMIVGDKLYKISFNNYNLSVTHIKKIKNSNFPVSARAIVKKGIANNILLAFSNIEGITDCVCSFSTANNELVIQKIYCVHSFWTGGTGPGYIPIRALSLFGNETCLVVDPSERTKNFIADVVYSQRIDDGVETILPIWQKGDPAPKKWIQGNNTACNQLLTNYVGGTNPSRVNNGPNIPMLLPLTPPTAGVDFVPAYFSNYSPVGSPLDDMTGIKMAECHALGYSNGSIYGWGNNQNGRLGLEGWFGNPGNLEQPGLIEIAGSSILHYEAEDTYSLFLANQAPPSNG